MTKSILSVDIGWKHMALCHKLYDDPKYYIYIFSVDDNITVPAKVKQLYDKMNIIMDMLPIQPTKVIIE